MADPTPSPAETAKPAEPKPAHGQPPAINPAPVKVSRDWHPGIVFIILMVLAIVGGGIYLWTHNGL